MELVFGHFLCKLGTWILFWYLMSMLLVPQLTQMVSIRFKPSSRWLLFTIDKLEPRNEWECQSEHLNLILWSLLDFISYLHEKVLRLLLKPSRVEGIVHTDGVEKLFFILPMERGLTNQHLIEEDAEGPPVNRMVVFLTQQDLCGQEAEM